MSLREQLLSLYASSFTNIMRNCLRCTIVLPVWFIYVIYIDFYWYIAVPYNWNNNPKLAFLICQSNLYLNQGVKIHFSANENAQKGALYLVRYYTYHEFFITFRGSCKSWTAKTNSTNVSHLSKIKLLLVIHELESWIPAFFSAKKCSKKEIF